MNSPPVSSVTNFCRTCKELFLHATIYKVKLTHIDNACCIYEAQGFKLLTDPWLTDGAFEGSWYHYPPLVTDFNYIKDVDALYISHLHPDHYDETILKQFRKDIPVIILDKEPNFLKRKLKDVIGFTNLIALQDKQTTTIGPFEVTIYAPFVKHPFDNSQLGNFIDSAIVVEANGKVILNANDNTPDVSAGKYLYDRHGKFDIAQLKDSLAGPYPACFTNLSNSEKLSESKRLIYRQLTAMCEVAKIMEAEWFQPFAGDYQLGGRLAVKNEFLGVSGKQNSAQFIAIHGFKPLILNEQGSIDLITGELKASYRPYLEGYQSWIERISKIPYEYEKEPQMTTKDWFKMQNKLHIARGNLYKFQEKYNYFPDLLIRIETQLGSYGFSMKHRKEEIGKKIDIKNSIKFKLDLRALLGVLDRRYHWNNLEVGCHIDIERIPNVYDPDLVNAMCFFHI